MKSDKVNPIVHKQDWTGEMEPEPLDTDCLYMAIVGESVDALVKPKRHTIIWYVVHAGNHLKTTEGELDEI